MRKIETWDGTEIEYTEQQFLVHLFHLSDILDNFVNNFSGGLDGFPDFDANETWDKSGKKTFLNILHIIDDKDLHDLYFSWGALIQQMYHINSELVACIATFFDLPAPQTQADKQEIVLWMSKANQAEWRHDPKYKILADQLKGVIAKASNIRNQISKLDPQLSQHPEIQEYLKLIQSYHSPDVETDEEENTTEIEPSDSVLDILEEELASHDKVVDDWQFAKDLIDYIDGESNPKRVIQILYLALRYQPAGIQANKAYTSLGMIYKDMEQNKKAIECYTKAMKMYEPEARLFLWRGELYYQLGEYVQAKHDLEQALTLQSSQPMSGLYSDEKETVEAYLAILTYLISG
ncbi:MAG: tetratricopeptide repeat protein [Anaerolineales bacterium]|nr:tetratricopeptide repeat protein [Anaerolineales bacterium]